MTSEARMIGYELLKKGVLVSFRVLEEEVLTAPADEAEFGLRLLLKFVQEGGEEDFDEDEGAENTAEWGAFGFIFVVALLSFADAKEKDELRLSDFIEHLRFVRGELHFDADYIRGRRLKTRIVVRSNGNVTLETIGRGKSALRWLERIQGRKLLELVGGPS
jgi:hypothetical protein